MWMGAMEPVSATEMIEGKALLPARLNSSILCGEGVVQGEVLHPHGDDDSVSSGEEVSETKFGDVDSRELLAARQLRRLRFSPEYHLAKRQKVEMEQTIQIATPVKGDGSTEWIAKVVRPKLRYLAERPEELDVKVQSSMQKLKMLHKTKLPGLIQRIEEASKQLETCRSVLEPIRSFVHESREGLQELVNLKNISEAATTTETKTE